MNWLYDPSRLTELLLKAGLVVAIAATLLAPLTRKAHREHSAQSVGKTSQQIPSAQSTF